MDDGTPIAKSTKTLDDAIEDMDAHDGFAVIHYRGRGLIMMTEEKFEQWEDAVDLARIQDSILNPDPEPRITLEALAEKLGIDLSGDDDAPDRLKP